MHRHIVRPLLRRPSSAVTRVWASSTSHRHGEYMNRVDEPFTPRRSLLYVPMHSDKMVGKVEKMTADCVVLELEDGVALNAKEVARRNCVSWLNKHGGATKNSKEIGLRVNSLESGLIDLDLQAISQAENQPAAFMVPKVQSVFDLHTLHSHFIRHYGGSRLGHMISKENIRLVIWIETGKAMLNLPSIIEAAGAMFHQREMFKLDAVVFGSDDYCADIGARRSSSAVEVLHARQHLVMCAKTFGVQAIDNVFIDLDDEEGLRRQSEEGADWGFTGKQVIHPSQVHVVQQAFTPSDDAVEWATQLIKGYEEHAREGRGAFIFRGNMIDRPLLEQARNLLKYIT